VAVKIKLKRLGKIRAPYYRIVIADSRTKRDGRAIEEIGKYHPKADPSFIEVNSERAQHWLKVGAQPTDPVRKILEVTGDWQKFKGLPGAEGTLRTAEPKADKKATFAAALAESLQESGAKTTKPKGRAAADAKAGDAKTADAKADKPARAGAKAEVKADKPAKADKPVKAEAKADKPAKAQDAAADATAEAAPEAPAADAAAEAPAAEAPAAEAPAAEAAAGTDATGAPEAPAASDAADTEAAPASDGAQAAGSEA
jgi:small subunit ribosomal protein S16